MHLHRPRLAAALATQIALVRQGARCKHLQADLSKPVAGNSEAHL